MRVRVPAPLVRVRGQVAREWLVAGVILLGVAALLMRNWLLMDGVPTSSRREVLAELSIVWMCRQELLQGQLLSEWNPLWFAGFPWLRFLAYPLYYVLGALSAWGGLSLETVMVAFFYVVLAGSGLAMYGYLRGVVDDWRAAIVGAIAYQAFPFHSHVGVETWIHAAFWVLFPLTLWLIDLARGQGPRRVNRLLLAGLALGCFPILSSEYAILAAPYAVLYLLFRELHDLRAGRRKVWPVLWGIALVGFVALGTAMFFVLPGLMETQHVGIHAKHGGAATLTDQLLRDYSVTPGLVWYAIAGRLGLPRNTQGLPALVSSFWSITWYPGLFAPLLAGAGLIVGRKRFAARFALVGLICSLLLITGPMFLLNPFTYLPVLGRLSPFRGLLLAVAFASVLVAYGTEWLLARWGRAWLRWCTWAALCALILFDFVGAASAYQVTPAYFDANERAAYAWLSEQVGDGRLWEPSDLPRDHYLRTYSLSQAPLPRYRGYYDNGAPLHTWEQNAWTDLATSLDLHRVRYVFLRHGEAESARALEAIKLLGYQQAFKQGGVEVWEHPERDDHARFYTCVALDVTQDFHHPFQALPEFVAHDIAMVTPASYHLDDHDPEELAGYCYYLVDEPTAHDPDTLARLSEVLAPKMVEATDVADLPVAQAPRTMIWTEQLSYEETYLEVRATEPGVLALSSSWYPHWRAYVDDQPVPTLRVNWAMLGVWLEPGMHRVTFRFERPWYAYAGYTATVLTLVALVLWWTWYVSHLLNGSRVVEWEPYQGTSSADDTYIS